VRERPRQERDDFDPDNQRKDVDRNAQRHEDPRSPRIPSSQLSRHARKITSLARWSAAVPVVAVPVR
jgi:hypothetical protein